MQVEFKENLSFKYPVCVYGNNGNLNVNMK